MQNFIEKNKFKFGKESASGGNPWAHQSSSSSSSVEIHPQYNPPDGNDSALDGTCPKCAINCKVGATMIEFIGRHEAYRMPKRPGHFQLQIKR